MMPDAAVAGASTDSPALSNFSCRRSGTGSVARVAVTGELNVATAPRLDSVLREAQAGAAQVILDLRGLTFADSDGAALLAAADRRLRDAGGRLTVVRGPAEIDRLFALTGLDRELELVDQSAVPDVLAQRGGMISTLAPGSEIAVVPLGGQIDPGMVAALQRRVSKVLEGAPTHLVIDLGAVTGIGTQTLSLLCGMLRRLSRRDATLAVVGADLRVLRVLDFCAIDGLEIHPTVDAVVAASHRGAPETRSMPLL